MGNDPIYMLVFAVHMGLPRLYELTLLIEEFTCSTSHAVSMVGHTNESVCYL